MRQFSVVFDVDGVITNITDYICDKYNIDPNKIKKYNIKECEELTSEEAANLIREYGNYLLYREVDVAEGADRIADIQLDYDCDIFIYSTCFNPGVAYSKFEFLKDNLLIPEENIELVINGDKGTKYAREDTDVIVEDCLENITLYPDDVYKILIDKTYNQTECSDEYMNIHRVPDLNSAIDLVEQYLTSKGLKIYTKA